MAVVPSLNENVPSFGAVAELYANAIVPAYITPLSPFKLLCHGVLLKELFDIFTIFGEKITLERFSQLENAPSPIDTIFEGSSKDDRPAPLKA